MRLRGQDLSQQAPEPDLGQHTREVLTELGLSGTELEGLVADGIVNDS